MKRFVPLAVAALALSLSQAALAEGSKFKVYGMGVYVAPLSSTNQTIGGVTDAVKASKEFGLNFGLEVRPSSLIGIELDYLYAKHDLKHGSTTVLGETQFQPISGTLNFHLPLAIVDLYGGPTAAYVNWGDIKVASGTNVKLDAEFGYGVSAGLDLNITPLVVATGGLRWLNVKAQETGGTQSVNVHPLFIRAGIAVKL